MTGLTTEIRGVHVGDSAITRGADDYEVDKRCNNHETDAMAEDGIGKINFGIDRRQLIGSLQMAMPKPDAYRNEQKTQNENGGQTQVENNAKVRII